MSSKLPPSADSLPEHIEEEKPRYTPRPRWQLILAWVLIAILVVSILNLCYWEVFQR